MTLRDQVNAGFINAVGSRHEWAEKWPPSKRGPVFGMSQQDIRVAIRGGMMLFEMEGREITQLTPAVTPRMGYTAMMVGQELPAMEEG